MVPVRGWVTAFLCGLCAAAGGCRTISDAVPAAWRASPQFPPVRAAAVERRLRTEAPPSQTAADTAAPTAADLFARAEAAPVSETAADLFARAEAAAAAPAVNGWAQAIPKTTTTWQPQTDRPAGDPGARQAGKTVSDVAQAEAGDSATAPESPSAPAKSASNCAVKPTRKKEKPADAGLRDRGAPSPRRPHLPQEPIALPESRSPRAEPGS
jgi:hypothetical protein